MEMKTILQDSTAYAIASVWKQWKRWVILTIMSVIFPFILGYMMEIYRGRDPAPEPGQWVTLFIDGLKLLTAGIIYMVPVIIIILATLIPMLPYLLAVVPADGELVTGPDIPGSSLILIAGGILLAGIAGIILTLISSIGIVRMARTETFTEAFNMSAILATIARIGWGSYILAMIILLVVIIAITLILWPLDSIPYIGWLIGFFLEVPLTIFEARYMTRIYDEAGE